MAKPEHDHLPGPCLNCGNYLNSTDLFCGQCGQKRIEKEDMSFNHLIGESFLDYFHFDSKLFRTLKPLLFKPGFLTLEFMKGKRKTYLEPFKLFLIISVIYFLLLPLSGESTHEYEKAEVQKSSKDKVQHNNLHPFKYSLKGMELSDAGQDSIKREIDTIGLKKYVDKNFSKYNAIVKLLMRQVFKILVYSGKTFTTVLEHTASKMIFLLIPLFALLLKLFYRKSGRLYFEHLIFSLHIHAFIFLILILVLIIEFIVNVKMLYIILIFLVYLFYALKRNYSGKNGKTLRKLFLLFLSYIIIALPVFFILLLLVSVFLV